MAMEIITGYTGIEHVTSADDASLYRGILGADDYVLDVGSKFAATIIDNNTVRIMDGDLLIQGHQARIRANDYNEVTIDNGTPGQKRNDLIVARYQKNIITGIESISLEVVRGTPGSTATDPEIVQGDLIIGATQRDYPLYRVALDGISLASLTTLFNIVPTFKSHLAEKATQDEYGHIRLQDIPNPTKASIGLGNVDNIKQATKTEFDEHLADHANPHNTNKADVGLSNVDNVKQMPISGGILEDYREKLVTLSGTSTAINLNLGNVFTHTLSGNTTYSISNAVNSQAHSFTLIITQTATVRTLTFPASVKWQGGEIPDMTTASKTYVLTFLTVDGGATWLGMSGGEF